MEPQEDRVARPPATIYRQRVERAVAHVTTHLAEDLTLTRVAAAADVSPFHFHRLFRGMGGEALAAFTRRLRLERAAHALRDTDRPIVDVAASVGYEAQESFTRAFKTAYGQAPGSYRRDPSREPALHTPNGAHAFADGSFSPFRPIPSLEIPMTVIVKRLEGRSMLRIRHVGPYTECGRAWEQLMSYAGRKRLLGPNVMCFGLCYDDPESTPPEEIRYDACIDVPEGLAVEPPFEVVQFEGGEYAATLHAGPYERLAATYQRLYGEWLPQSGRELREAPCVEVYQNSPQDTRPEDLRTDVFVPLK